MASGSSIIHAQEIDAICDRFEAELRAGGRPQIEEYLQRVDPAQLADLRRELELVEAAYRQPADEPTQAHSDSPLRSQERPTIGLTVIAGPNRGAQFRFDHHETFVVGRSKAAHLRLPPRDPYFSRHHFLLEVNPPHCRLTNLSQTNGTLVNGCRVDCAELKAGDLILAGDTAIQVQIAGAPPARAAKLPSPTQPETLVELKPYTLLRKLGDGGMGQVFLARENASGQLCAVKTIIPAAAASADEVQRFLREAAILQRLKHPAIVGFHNCGEVRGRVYFAMEFVAGSDAARVLAHLGRFPVGRAVRLICQALEALGHAHEQGFVHRDVKPANLLLHAGRGSEQVKLADFGLARVYQASTLSGLTLDGDFGGSLPFLPPEQLLDYRNVDPRCDIYAAGATLYTLLTGRYTFDFPQRAADRMLLVLQAEPADIGLHRPELPVPLRQAIHRSLAREPGDRFASAAQMRAALLPFAADCSV